MDLIKKIRRNAYNPEFWKNSLSLKKGVLPLYYRLTTTSGVHVMSEEWDILVILDACRYDLFEEVASPLLPGTLEYRRSCASATPNFLRENFSGSENYDTVYVTANPQVNIRIKSEEIFHKVIPVWKDDWDSDLGTVRPEPMADRVIESAHQYPDKRIIAHFVQPHYPFLGETASLIDHPGINGETIDEMVGQDLSDREDIWTRLEKGEIEIDTVWDAYAETLEETIPSVKRILDQINGKKVITSDHGNMIGERAGPIKIYGHPANILTDELTRVPWLIVPGKDRRITTEPPESSTQTEEKEIQNRLKALGYKE